MHTCIGSRISCGLNVAAIYNHVGKSTEWPLFFALSGVVFTISAFLIFMPPFLYPTLFSLFPLLSRFDGCADVPVWRLRAGLQGLLVMGALYCLGAG